MRVAIFCAVAVLAALTPVLPRPETQATRVSTFPGWPEEFDGEKLDRLPPGPQDDWFARDFPGRVARFATADKQVVVRWIDAPTRRLHPASHCFRGAGYAISPRPMRVARRGGGMSCFTATKDGESLEVCEQIRHLDEDDDGRTWPDVSSWYWSAVTAPAEESWWSYVVVTRER